MKKKYLIIGINSFIAKNLLAVKKFNNNYFSLSINPKNKKNLIINKGKINFCKIDRLLKDYGIPETVFFLSWAGMERPYSLAENIYNFKIYKKLIKYFYDKKIINIIFFGSIKEYGKQSGNLNEDLINLKPDCYYGKYKLALGRYGLKVAKKMKKNFLHLRVSHVFGLDHRSSKLLNKIFISKCFNNDRNLYFYRNMIYIKDLIKILIKCVRFPFNDVLNVGHNKTCIYIKFIINYCKIARIKNIISSSLRKVSLDENYQYFKYSIKKMELRLDFKDFTSASKALKELYYQQKKILFIK